MYALKCRIKVSLIVRHASWPVSGGYCHRANYASSFSPFVVQHTSLVCQGGGGERGTAFRRGLGVARGTGRRVSIGNNEGAGTYGRQ